MHHVTARSIAEERIFRDSGDYATGISILAELVREGLVVCHQFCFMPTHYHLLGTFFDVSAAVHKLNRRYATRFNKRYGRHLIQLPRHIALNPKNYETWPFGSYPGLIGLREAFSFVDPTPILETFGSAAAFRAYVDEGREVEDTNLVPASPVTRFDSRGPVLGCRSEPGGSLRTP
jgi:REP element-mobilizing transposase RayT